MKRSIRASAHRTALCLFYLLSTAPGFALTLNNGNILGEDSVAPGGTTFTLVEYSPAGAIQGTLPITSVPGGYGTMSGVAVVGGQVWTVGTNGIVAQVDLATGALNSSFVTGLSAEALGNLGNDLLIGQSNGVIKRYTTAGSLVSSITLAGGSGLHVEGLDSDGSRIFAASSGGNVYTFDLSGNQLGSFATGDSLSGLGVDFATGNLWVSAGFGSDNILQYTQAGAFVSSFYSARSFINGLDVVPEPASAALLSAAGLLTLRLRRHRRSCT